MEIIEVHQLLETMPDKIYEAECEYVKARAVYQYLDDMKKHVLSAVKEVMTGSNPERESQAYASKRYAEHLDGIREACIMSGMCAAKLHQYENRFESARSIKGLIK
jgi:hypothetical protein